jgi:hypothetical protein
METETLMSPQVLEVTWEEIVRQAERLAGKRVRLTILEDVDPPPRSGVPGTPQPGMIRFGMFPQLAQLTDEDFRSVDVPTGRQGQR